jgi:DNA-binding IclR family transcriptional regulator
MSDAQPVQAVVRSLRLLEALANADGGDVGVVDVARATGLSQATAHRLLATLGGEGYVAQSTTTSRYRLGPRLFALATAAESEIAALRASATPVMHELQEALGETVNLSVLDRRHIIYVDQVESERAIRAFNRTGNRVAAHASAAGKVLLAFEPEAVLDGLAHGAPLEALTAATTTAPRELIAQLDEIRARGYAFDLGEHDEDVVCVAAPITAAGRRPAGALSVSGPADRMRRLDLADVGVRVARMASRILA